MARDASEDFGGTRFHPVQLMCLSSVNYLITVVSCFDLYTLKNYTDIIVLKVKYLYLF